MSDRYETRPSPITNYIWVTWDTQDHRIMFGSASQDDVDAVTTKMNTDNTSPPVTPSEEAKS